MRYALIVTFIADEKQYVSKAKMVELTDRNKALGLETPSMMIYFITTIRFKVIFE